MHPHFGPIWIVRGDKLLIMPISPAGAFWLKYLGKPNKPSLKLINYAKGFSLAELLIAGFIGTILVVSGASIAVQNINSTKRLVDLQALRSNWTRITLMINTDSSESCLVSKTVSSLTFYIPSSSTTSCTTSLPSVTYAISSGNLTRNGPPINRDGTLDLAANNITSVIYSSASLDTTCASSFNACYNLILTNNGLSYSGDGTQTAGNRARVRGF